MKKPSLRVTLELVFWIGLLALIGYRLWPQASAALGLGSTGTPAPAVEIETLDGERIALAELRGHVVLVNFWATWCGPCRIEMPGFQSVYDEHRDQGFTILGLSTDVGTPDLVRDFVRAEGITYPIAYATGGARRAFGGVPALPTSLLIDRQGRIRHRVTGIFAEPALRRAVRNLLSEPATPSPRPEPEPEP